MALHYLGELAIRIVIIYAGIAGGFLLQKWSKAAKLGKWLLFVGINILSPALLIVVFLDMDTGSLTSLNWWFIVLVTTLGMGLSMIIDWLMLRKKKKDLPCQTIGAEINTTGFMNALFFPFPIIIGIMTGDMLAEGLLAASLYLIVQTVYRNTLGVYFGIHFGSTEHKSIWKIVKGLLLFPPTIGMAIGLILRFSIGQVTIAHHFADYARVDLNTILNLNYLPLGFFSLGDYEAVIVFQDISMVIMLALVGLSFKLPKKEEWKEVALFRQIVARFGGGLIVVMKCYMRFIKLLKLRK